MKIDMEFEKMLKTLPQEQRDFFKSQRVRSMEDLFMFMVKNGIDPLKMMDESLSDPRKNPEDYDVKDFAIEKGGEMDALRQILTMGEEGYDDEYESDDECDDDDVEIWPGDDDEYPQGLLLEGDSKEYHIRIKLNNCPIDVWRELYVPSNISLELLAEILIEVMGWQGYHLHQFQKGNVLYRSTIDMEETMTFFDNSRSMDANEVALGQVLQKKGDRMRFEYDFGDSWTHDVWLKGEREYKAGEQPRAKLLKGKGACPPEDCGGVWGYADLLAIRKKKRKTAEDKERLEWAGMDKYFDPDFFDEEELTFYIEEYWEGVLDEIKARKS